MQAQQAKQSKRNVRPPATQQQRHSYAEMNEDNMAEGFQEWSDSYRGSYQNDFNVFNRPISLPKLDFSTQQTNTNRSRFTMERRDRETIAEGSAAKPRQLFVD